MRKFLTIFITLIFTFCLITINGKCSAAESNDDTHKWSSTGGWDPNVTSKHYDLGDDVYIQNDEAAGGKNIYVTVSGHSYDTIAPAGKTKYSMSASGTFNFSVDVNGNGTVDLILDDIPQPSPTPSPDPDPTYESCEKVIGPTWHWNDDKGVCEEYSTVGTATR